MEDTDIQPVYSSLEDKERSMIERPPYIEVLSYRISQACQL